MIAAGTKIAQLGYTAEGSQAEDVVNLAQAEVYEMSTGKVRQDYAPIGTVITDTLDQIDRLQNGEVSKGVPTGFRDIDDVTQGLQPGQMIVVAGRPAMGKSTLGVDFARAAALHHNMTSVIFSLEMSKTELAQRIIRRKRIFRCQPCAERKKSRRNVGISSIIYRINCRTHHYSSTIVRT